MTERDSLRALLADVGGADVALCFFAAAFAWFAAVSLTVWLLDRREAERGD